jgi:hypothetical protein
MPDDLDFNSSKQFAASSGAYFYHISVLRRMVDQLPDDIKKHIHEQISEVENAFANQMKAITETVLPILQDIVVDVRYMEFDRQATIKERDDAIRKYKDGSSS